jgi:uncharacterized protein
MRRTSSLALATIVAGAVAGLADTRVECTGAKDPIKNLICSVPELAELDARVADRFNAALRIASGGGSRAELRSIQSGWIRGLESCEASEVPTACLAAGYLRQEARLVALYVLEDPVETRVWNCAGALPSELVTMAFDTEWPAMRFEHGNTVDAGIQVYNGPVRRYEGSSGRAIAIFGDTARYREPDSEGSVWSCEALS